MNPSVFVIAEAGVNHNGDLNLALKLIDAAAEAGADAVKFQTFDPRELVTQKAEKAAYQIRNDGESSQFEMLSRLALKPEQFEELSAHCLKRNITFMSSAFDLKSVDVLKALNMSIYKIPSGEITNLPYLKKIAGLGKSIILSTGMANLSEVKEALELLYQNGVNKSQITVLHCTSDYPAPVESVNLRAMDTLRETFGVGVGYSDHTEGLLVPLAAVARGAQVIEKHFTLDRSMEGPDHRASLEPSELAEMVSSIRKIEVALGSVEKKPGAAELTNSLCVRKSIVAARPIKKGEILNEESLTTKRPGSGLSPMRWNEVIGTRAARDFNEDDLINL